MTTNQVQKIVAMACFAVALSSAVFAQDMQETMVRANIPFDFYAGNQKLPAGVYAFQVSVDHRITLHNQTTGRTYSILTKPADGRAYTKASLTFDDDGSVYLLHSLQDSSVSVSFFENRTLLSKVSDPSTVTIALGE